MDTEIRAAMNRNGAKHFQQISDLLYMPKSQGGRGLRSLEDTYKQTKVKAAIKLPQVVIQELS